MCVRGRGAGDPPTPRPTPPTSGLVPQSESRRDSLFTHDRVHNLRAERHACTGLYWGDQALSRLIHFPLPQDGTFLQPVCQEIVVKRWLEELLQFPASLLPPRVWFPNRRVDAINVSRIIGSAYRQCWERKSIHTLIHFTSPG